MANFNTISSKTKTFWLLSTSMIFLVSCGSYRNASYYENDTNGRRTVQAETRNANAVVYKQYFKSVSESTEEVFTDVENYTTPNDTIVVVEQRNNGGWGTNPTVVNVNVYDNSWMGAGWGMGMGWNNWGWNSWGFGGWGWNNWGWGGWYDPFWGPGWGMGWNNWGMGWNSWCAPGWGWNNWHHGNAFASGRRPTSLIPQGGRSLGRSLVSNDRSLSNSRFGNGRSSNRLTSDRTSTSRESGRTTSDRTTTGRTTTGRTTTGRYDDSRVNNQGTTTTRPSRTYTPSSSSDSRPSRTYSPSSSSPSRTYSPSSSSPSRSSGGSFGGGSRGGSFGGGSSGGGRSSGGGGGRGRG